MKNRGFTLIEVMVSLIIGAFILAGVMFTYQAMKLTTKDTLAIGQLQSSASNAIELLARDIAMIGFWGTFNQEPNEENLKLIPTPISQDCNAGNNGGSFPEKEQNSQFKYIYGMIGENHPNLNCVVSGKSGSDIIQLKHLVGHNSTNQNTSTGRYYLVVEGEQMRFEKGTGSPIATAGNGEVWPYKHQVYYVKEETLTLNNRNLIIPSLMRAHLIRGRMVEEVVMEGVELLRFSFGIDTNGNGRVNEYVSMKSMTDQHWSMNMGDIITVRIAVLARTISDQTLPKPQSHEFKVSDTGDAAYDVVSFNDRIRRKLIVSTVRLANVGADAWKL